MKAAIAAAAALVCALAAALPAGAAAKVPRPTYRTAEVTISTPFVVVHYTRTGPDHPRFMADDDHDNVPNYIEKLAASANKAWLWYAHNGFKAPLPDTAGPDQKLDIYVKALPPGTYGVTIPTSQAQGGAFMVIDNQLDEAHLAKHGSLQQTVAHELFHAFQLSYVPDGNIPHWAAEGSAVAMQTYVYPQIADLATFDYLDTWLTNPERSLYDEGQNCDHCYGGALWWRFVFGLGNHVLSDYFGRLYGYEKVHKPIRNGLQPLDEILQKRDHSNLYETFSRFSYDIYRANYRPATAYTLHASSAVRTSATYVVRGLSTHYVRVTVPPSAKGIGIAVAAAGGPTPNVKVVVGGPKGRALTAGTRDAHHLQFTVAAFRSAKERTSVELIITSGREVGTAYRVVYQAL